MYAWKGQATGISNKFIVLFKIVDKIALSKFPFWSLHGGNTPQIMSVGRYANYQHDTNGPGFLCKCTAWRLMYNTNHILAFGRRWQLLSLTAYYLCYSGRQKTSKQSHFVVFYKIFCPSKQLHSKQMFNGKL